MSILDLFRRRSAVVYRSVVVASVMGKPVQEVYRTQPALHAVVSFLASNAGSLPLKCYDRASDTDRPRVTEGVVPSLLARPNPHETIHDLLVGTFSDLLLYGWALLYVTPDAGSASGWQMTRLPPSWAELTPTVDGFAPEFYRMKNPFTVAPSVDFPAGDCVRIMTYDPDGTVYPSSPVESLKAVLAEQVASMDFRNASWRNGGKVSAVLKRPKDAPQWSPEARNRFIQSWKERFSGEGDDTGGTPLLEDGMDLVATTFNAKDAEWAEATRLARADVAAVYHVNPALIWHEQAMTYASAKDNARALYSETLAPWLSAVESSLNAFLLPKIGAPSSQYVEFDLSAKLKGSFEEQASVMQSAVGRPYISVNEARAHMNLPAIDGGDSLAVPLNLEVEGSGQDAEEVEDRAQGEKDACCATKEDADEIRIKSTPSDAAVENLSEVFGKFRTRQATSVVNRIAATDPGKLLDLDENGFPEWWQGARWGSELHEDLDAVAARIVEDSARAVLDDLGGGTIDRLAIEAFVTKVNAARSAMVNNAVMEDLLGSMCAAAADEALTSASASRIAGDYYASHDGWAGRQATSYATMLTNYGAEEGAKASGRECWKVWRCSKASKPRPSHARMDGERVRVGEDFSNGARWPGDQDALGPADICNCKCTLEISAKKR